MPWWWLVSWSSICSKINYAKSDQLEPSALTLTIPFLPNSPIRGRGSYVLPLLSKSQKRQKKCSNIPRLQSMTHQAALYFGPDTWRFFESQRSIELALASPYFTILLDTITNLSQKSYHDPIKSQNWSIFHPGLQELHRCFLHQTTLT